MAVEFAAKAVCSVADSAPDTTVYHALRHLSVARFSAGQALRRANSVEDDAFTRFMPNGERQVDMVLEGLSDGGQAERLLRDALFEGRVCLVRMDSAQGERIAGAFWVSEFQTEAAGPGFERLRIGLRSQGEVGRSTL